LFKKRLLKAELTIC
jgi:cytochrome P450